MKTLSRGIAAGLLVAAFSLVAPVGSWAAGGGTCKCPTPTSNGCYTITWPCVGHVSLVMTYCNCVPGCSVESTDPCKLKVNCDQGGGGVLQEAKPC